jgi:hypothetical protein
MANDIAPALLETLKASFAAKYEQSKKVNTLLTVINDGKATYKEVNDLASEVGDILASVFQENLSSEMLPDGRMYYNIAKRTVEPMMTNNYNIVADNGKLVQEALNKQAGLGIKAQVPPLNSSRVNGIINRLDAEELFDNIKWILDEPIVNFSMSVVDDMVKANMDFHHKLGLKPRITRKAAAGCCEWCDALEGEYEYPDDVPDDVFRRHQRCRCTTEYNPVSGKRQNVWTKQ